MLQVISHYLSSTSSNFSILLFGFSLFGALIRQRRRSVVRPEDCQPDWNYVQASDLPCYRVECKSAIRDQIGPNERLQC